MSELIKCPYCGHEQNVDHGEGEGYEEDEQFEQECEKCRKTFLCTTYVTYNYESIELLIDTYEKLKEERPKI